MNLDFKLLMFFEQAVKIWLLQMQLLLLNKPEDAKIVSRKYIFEKFW